MNIIPDPLVVVLQVVPFLFVIFALHRLIFAPMLAHLDARAAAIAGGRREAAQLQDEIALRMAEYEKRLADARRKVSELRAQKREAAQKRHAEVAEAARKEADAHVAEAVLGIARAREGARAELEANARTLAGGIADRVLRRGGASDATVGAK